MSDTLTGPQLSRRTLFRGAAVVAVSSTLVGALGLGAMAAQKALKYTFHAQEKGYSCSAGTSKMLLSARGITVSEATLRSALGLNGGGLPNIANLVRVLNNYTKTSAYEVRQWSDAQYAAKLDADVRYSVDRGFGVAFNTWYYNVGHNVPRRTSSGHYFAIMGYSDTQYYVADPASSKNGPGFWVAKSTVVSWRKNNRYVAAINAKGGGTTPPTTPPPTTPPASAWPVLQSGASGYRVSVAQHLLRQRGATALIVDGSYGAKSVAAVKAFQTASGLSADGVLGAKSWAKLVAVVQSGTKGEAARAAQVALNANGAKLVVDGIFGAGSVAAAKAFQKAKGLTADGIVGVKTWETLV